MIALELLDTLCRICQYKEMRVGSKTLPVRIHPEPESSVMAPPLIEKLEGARPPPILICPSSSCPREPDCPPEAVIPNQHDDLWTRGEADAAVINESVARECIADLCFRCRFPETSVDESKTGPYSFGGGFIYLKSRRLVWYRATSKPIRMTSRCSLLRSRTTNRCRYYDFAQCLLGF